MRRKTLLLRFLQVLYSFVSVMKGLVDSTTKPWFTRSGLQSVDHPAMSPDVATPWIMTRGELLEFADSIWWLVSIITTGNHWIGRSRRIEFLSFLKSTLLLFFRSLIVTLSFIQTSLNSSLKEKERKKNDKNLKNEKDIASSIVLFFLTLTISFIQKLLKIFSRKLEKWQIHKDSTKRWSTNLFFKNISNWTFQRTLLYETQSPIRSVFLDPRQEIVFNSVETTFQ